MKKIGFLLFYFFLSNQLFAQLSLGKVFGSNMVLQREKPIRFFGKSIPNDSIFITFSNSTISTKTQSDSTWNAIFEPQKANKISQNLKIQNRKESILITNILIGDVWLCAGQSNMEFPLKKDSDFKETIKSVSNSNLRLFNYNKALPTTNKPFQANKISFLSPQNFFEGSWAISDSTSAVDFSAIAFYFGRNIEAKIDIPIGLINLAVGGSPLEAWLNENVTKGNVELNKIYQGDWMKNQYLEEWCIMRASQNLDSLIQRKIPIPNDKNGFNHPYKPAFLYSSIIESFAKVAIKGVIWYQGESNSLSKWRAEQHTLLFPLFIESWRNLWGQSLPFYFCQLSSISTKNGYKSENWGYFRDSQRISADTIPNVGMAVTSDVGHLTDVHPTQKKIVGERLANIALNKTYEFKNIVCEGPKPLKKAVKQRQISLKFDSKLQISDGQTLKGFEIETTEGVIQKVNPIIKNKKIIIKTDLKSSRILYGYQPYSEGNLINAYGLPCSTFSIKL